MSRTMLAVALMACSTGPVGSTGLDPRPPQPVTFPKAGGTFKDPAFGSTLHRVTDANHGRRCVHYYSYGQPWNADQTRLLLACDDVPLLYSFDAATGTTRRLGELGAPIQFEGASWSRDVAATLYALDRRGPQLVRVNADSGAMTTIRDFGADFPGKELRQLSASEGGGTVAFRVGAGGAAVWGRADDAVFTFPLRPGEQVNEIQLSKGGSHAVVHLEDGGAVQWDYRTGERRFLPNSTGHWDLGRSWMVNGDGILTGVQRRGYGWSALEPVNVLRYLTPSKLPVWSIAEHVSLRADAEDRILVSTYAGKGTFANAFEDEIVLVRTDGTGFLRLSHTFSCECAASSAARYWTQPRATMSRDGRWVLFDSDLGSATRVDVLLVRVP